MNFPSHSHFHHLKEVDGWKRVRGQCFPSRPQYVITKFTPFSTAIYLSLRGKLHSQWKIHATKERISKQIAMPFSTQFPTKNQHSQLPRTVCKVLHINACFPFSVLFFYLTCTRKQCLIFLEDSFPHENSLHVFILSSGPILIILLKSRHEFSMGTQWRLILIILRCYVYFMTKKCF